MNLNYLIISAVLGVVFLTSGCASKKLYTKNSGFFKDYEQLDKQVDVSGSAHENNIDLDISSYKDIIIAPVKVISSINLDKQTVAQKKLYKEISEYLTEELKKELSNNPKYNLVDASAKNALILETAISTVEVHFDDPAWYPFSSIPMGLTVVSYNVYMDEDVRILGEKRLLDSQTRKVLQRSMNIQKDIKITASGDSLEFANVKPALDSWLSELKKDFAK